MTRRNDKRNNNSELNSFAKILLGALLGKGAGMITEVLMKKAEEKTEDKPHTVIRQCDNLLESSCIINGDGSATEIPIPDGFQIFISEDGKPMIRKKIEGDEKKNKTPDAAENVAITYDDISKKLFLNKKIFFILGKYIDSGTAHDENYDDSDNCTSEAQAKRMAAFNKLQNIAKYLNDGWKPDFKGSTRNWFISKKRGEEYRVIFTYSDNAEIVFFKSACLAKEAICLMGEESLNDLFSTDW